MLSLLSENPRFWDPKRAKIIFFRDNVIKVYQKYANIYIHRLVQTCVTFYCHLHVITLNGMKTLIITLLDQGFTYVLPGEFQSDRIEAEFGIYRQSSGSNYYISVDQVQNALHLQRLKLFAKLEIEQQEFHQKKECCSAEFTEDELICMDNCFEDASNLTANEKATLYYISGYVTFKEGMSPGLLENDNHKDVSEFTKLVSRGKLSAPNENVFEISLFFYTYFKSLKEKICSNRIVKAFNNICEVSYVSFENREKIFRRFVNCFMKGFSKQQSDKIVKTNKSDTTTVKKRRLRYQ